MSVAPEDMAQSLPAAQTVLLRTSLGGYVFDAILNVQHESTLTITQHTVETGAAVSDHAYVNPARLTLQIGMSDVATPIGDQFTGGSSRSVTAYQLLLDLQASRIPLRLTTRLKSYDNMLIQSISAPDDHTTAYGLRATIVLQQVFVAVVRTVKISSRPHITDSTNRGTVEPVPADASWLYQLQQRLYGPSNR